MSGLSESEREALAAVFEARRAGVRSDDLNIFASIEQIIAVRVTSALTEAADAIDLGTRMDEDGAPLDDYALGRQHAARIVRFVAEDRAAIPTDPAPPEDPVVR